MAINGGMRRVGKSVNCLHEDAQSDTDSELLFATLTRLASEFSSTV
jgi:hypothetical protein